MDRLNTFMELSALLTGEYKIVNDPDYKALSVSTANEYLRGLTGEFTIRLQALLDAYEKVAAAGPRPPSDDTLLPAFRAEQGFKDNEYVAKQIVNIWYFSQFQANEKDPNAPFIDGGFYERGLV